MQLDETVGSGDGGIRFFKLIVGVSGIQLCLFGVLSERIFGFQCLEMLDGRLVVTGLQGRLGLAVK